MDTKKQEDDFVITPDRGKGEKHIPDMGLLLINPFEWGIVQSSCTGEEWQRRFLFNSNLYVNEDDGIFVAGPAVGAPMAVLCLEKLIALGAGKIVVFGWCGGLKPGDIVGDVINVKSAFSGEGTSSYYSNETTFHSDAALYKDLEKCLDNADCSYRTGKVWSTDAPYRERKSTLAGLIDSEMVDGVEMELSALFSVAILRKVQIGATLLISDLPLSKSWTPGYRQKAFKDKSKFLVKILLEGFSK